MFTIFVEYNESTKVHNFALLLSAQLSLNFYDISYSNTSSAKYLSTYILLSNLQNAKYLIIVFHSHISWLNYQMLRLRYQMLSKCIIFNVHILLLSHFSNWTAIQYMCLYWTAINCISFPHNAHSIHKINYAMTAHNFSLLQLLCCTIY